MFLVVLLPVRAGLVILHRKVSLKESKAESLPIAMSKIPTLVFGLVLAGMLRDVFNVTSYIFGGLIVYTIVATILPSFILNRPVLPKQAEDLQVLP